jgi:hypothetical protein
VGASGGGRERRVGASGGRARAAGYFGRWTRAAPCAESVRVVRFGNGCPAILCKLHKIEEKQKTYGHFFVQIAQNRMARRRNGQRRAG